jgi:uncharacterized protein YjbI with pentapeptide repeats
VQFDSKTFQGKLIKPATWEESTYQFCELDSVNLEGEHITSTFIDCTFENCDMYWAFFNTANLIGVAFKKCKFRGVSFASCRLVECVFIDCEFAKSNLGGDCSFDDCRWYDCKQCDTLGLDSNLAAKVARGTLL